MSFQTAIARDSDFIHARAGGEFNVEVKFWAKDLDPAVDPATSTTRGTRFEQPEARKYTSDGVSEARMVIATVTKAAVASIDEQGYVSVDSVVYSIRSVSGADGVNWVVSAERDELYEMGDSARFYGMR